MIIKLLKKVLKRDVVLAILEGVAIGVTIYILNEKVGGFEWLMKLLRLN